MEKIVSREELFNAIDKCNFFSASRKNTLKTLINNANTKNIVTAKLQIMAEEACQTKATFCCNRKRLEEDQLLDYLSYGRRKIYKINMDKVNLFVD